ncbi:sulfurtransferase complex subunit TusB [Psychromonas sp. B3M02]|uniref:sulfurtransferase complex subunit TusB n=1 Tax=Psychromonas sp. B3M02 TaxID=2267226 RepID=UPI000DEAAC17|nr:sulfurtransferase complex subunit TusB [Psychromonas sp. B3M02]RBW41574.1 sulfurtransferase complex subunit TusB [Psychromonas sp. B3M02]
MILHTVNRSPFSSYALSDCIKQLGDTDIVLLLSDAVIASAANSELHDKLLQLHENKRLFVLAADVDARAIEVKLGKVIDYSEFVALTVQCKSQLNWT